MQALQCSHSEHLPANPRSFEEALLLLTGTALTAEFTIHTGWAPNAALSLLPAVLILGAQQLPGQPGPALAWSLFKALKLPACGLIHEAQCLQALHCLAKEHSLRPCSTAVPQSPAQKPGQLLLQLLYALALHRYSAAISQQLCKLQEARSQLLHFVWAGGGLLAPAVLRVLALQ